VVPFYSALDRSQSHHDRRLAERQQANESDAVGIRRQNGSDENCFRATLQGELSDLRVGTASKTLGAHSRARFGPLSYSLLHQARSVMASAQGRTQPGASRNARLTRGSSIDNQTIAFWQRRTKRPMTDLDARQIITNATAFFRILREWRCSEKPIGQSKHPDTGYS
jgi:hypothetical protein